MIFEKIFLASNQNLIQSNRIKILLFQLLSKSNILLQQVRVLDPLSNQDRIADVLIVDNTIEAIETRFLAIPDGTPIIDGRELIFAPGLVDLYSYSGEPGREERGTLENLTEAARAGGFTRVAILPNTVPAIDNPATLSLLNRKCEHLRSPFCLYFWGALTMGLAGQQMSEFADLAAAGAIGFADGRSIKNLALLRRLLEYIKPLNKPIALVPLSEALQGNGVMREGSNSIYYGLPGIPAIAETVAIASLLELIAATETPVHLMRISTRRGVELIAQAKARGVPVTASTTWMHLLFNTDDIASYDPNLRLEPPLGDREDMEALIEAVKQGTIDAIAIDSMPYTYEEKTLSFAEAPPGAIGLEFALPLLWERFVQSGQWSALDLWQSLSLRPLSCLQQKPISIAPKQSAAEAILFAPQVTWTLDESALESVCSNTPWFGKTITGRVLSKVD
jgi:dihydroorotase